MRSHCDEKIASAHVVCAGEMEALQDAIGTGTTDQAEMLARLIKRVANLEAAVADSANKRRELHNQLIELRGNVRGPHIDPGRIIAHDGSLRYCRGAQTHTYSCLLAVVC